MHTEPTLDIQCETHGERVCLHLAGEIIYQTNKLFAAEIEKVLALPVREVIVDMSKVKFIDSTGIGTLIGFKLSCQAREKNLILANPPETVSQSLEMMRMDKMFTIRMDD